MYKRLFLLGLLVIFGSGADLLALPYPNVCEEQSKPVLAYQNLLTDRTQEFWFDRNKEVLQGLWFLKKEPPMYLVGREYSENQFYLW